jgi:DNA-binding winged helix-turn-helix (wHTH) protein
MSLLLVGSEEAFTRDLREMMMPGSRFRVLARSSSLLDAEACLESKAIDMVLLSPEYRDEERSLFTHDARRRGFAGLILLAADTPGRMGENDAQTRDSIQIGDFFLHVTKSRAWVRGAEMQFSPQEFELLQFLCMHPAELLSYQTLIEVLWGNDSTSRHTLRVLIAALRTKIETGKSPQYIVTEREAGYRFIPSPVHSM